MNVLRTVPKMGDSSLDVVTVQNALTAWWLKNYRPPSPLVPDGNFTLFMERIIRLFQQQNGITTNFPGTLTPQTLEKLGLTLTPINKTTQKRTITRDFAGKKDRKIHPDLRIAFENVAFPNGEVPKCFREKNLIECRLHLCRAFARLEISESSQNNFGKEVGWIQGTTGKFVSGGNGDDWCMDQSQVIVAMIEDFYQIESPYPATASTIQCWTEASKIPGLTTTVCEVGTTLIARRNERQGHSMDVLREISWDTIETLEGNVKNRSLIMTRNKFVNGDLVTLGFVRTFPNNRIP